MLASYNERENLPALIDSFAGLGLPPYEVIVVDDGSTDGTRDYLRSALASNPRIRAVFNDCKQTLTVAHLHGIALARGKFVIIMDSDRQHPSEGVPRLLAQLRSGADIAVGSRYVPGGSTGGRAPLRGIISRTAVLFARCYIPEARPITDPISGFFGFRRVLFRPYDDRYRGYETLMFVLVMSRGRSIVEIPYAFQPRYAGTSQITQNLSFVRVFLSQLVYTTLFRLDLRRIDRASRFAASRAERTHAESSSP